MPLKRPPETTPLQISGCFKIQQNFKKEITILIYFDILFDINVNFYLLPWLVWHLFTQFKLLFKIHISHLTPLKTLGKWERNYLKRDMHINLVFIFRKEDCVFFFFFFFFLLRRHTSNLKREVYCVKDFKMI